MNESFSTLRENLGRDFDESLNSKAISLDSWISSFRDEEELREIFLNMDRAMKYLHDRDYCIADFNPCSIMILNDSLNQIKFKVVRMPESIEEKKQTIKDDIYKSSFVQIGIYSNCLSYLNKDFLKNNFDKFSQFVPEGDVPYYRGIICRGASVYLCEFALEKANRDLASLETELGINETSSTSNVQKKKMDNLGVNDKINDYIYKNIGRSRRNDAAFVNFVIYPTAILVGLLIMTLISWIISLG